MVWIYVKQENLAIIVFTILITPAFGSTNVNLPLEGFSSAESIIYCESQVKKIERIQKTEDNLTKSYAQINNGADSFIYFFTTPNEPAHPAMIKMTLHAKFNPLKLQKDDIEFYESYTSKEELYASWRKRILFDFGQGYAASAFQSANKRMPE